MCAECNYFTMKVFGWAFFDPIVHQLILPREKKRERVRLLSSLVPFVFSLGFVDDDKPLPEAKFHRLQSVNVEVGCCLLVPQYRTIFLWVFKVYWLKSQKILGWLIKYISSTLTLTFLLVLLLTCINCKKSIFFQTETIISYPTLMMLKRFCNQYDLKFPPRQNRRLQSSRL